MDITAKAEQWAEWIAQGVYDQPSIETREEFKRAIDLAIRDVANDLWNEFHRIQDKDLTRSS